MQNPAEHLSDIYTFVEVARAGGFLRAARHLGRSGSAVSKAVTRLEEQLQVRLFLRTTRRIALTPEGSIFFQQCERILGEVEKASEEAVAQGRSPSGVLRVQLSQLWSREALVPELASFQASFPDIELQLVFTERDVDLIDERIDIAVRVGLVDEKTLIAKPLVHTRSCVVAARAYLDRAGTPSVPDDLKHHRCIHFLTPDAHQPLPWHLSRDDVVTYHVASSPPFLLVNDPYAMRDAAVAGLGLAQGPDFLFADALRSGLLQRVLRRWEMPGPVICLVWPRNQFLPRRARAFIDWIGELTSRKGAAHP
jgi:LysR family transcriptional regulator for bpeEF and oprC